MIEPEEAERVRKRWETWGEGVRLVILIHPTGSGGADAGIHRRDCR